MSTVSYLERVHESVRSDGRYPLDAYVFLHQGLEHTAGQLYATAPEDETARHVSGQQLCCGLRDLAVTRWGPLAGLVLGRWGIRSTRDFGAMVYVLVEAGLLGKQDSDRIEDFHGVFDFHEAFGRYDTPLASFDVAAPADA